ncbi:MAG: Gfo/Idh/MocA family oxidoreductase, partial [Kiritimatiellae bacterium]|nr:Gfo/Idh/MocA family oxidoreductase [Kiritimatiellia bacterium]
YFGNSDCWKGACDDPEVDVVYVAVPAYLHARIALYAMNAGKHVLVEVPAANTIDDCWNIVETSERTRRHCMMLENCCYGEDELLAWSLCHQGVLGSLSHAEGAYIHNLTERHLENSFRNRGKPKKSFLRGNSYPTHPLGPICLYLDVNRGDRMNTVVSVTSGSFTWKDYIAATFKPDDWQSKMVIDRGDINTSIIKTARGRTIMLQLDFTTPRPYSRINLVQGSRGCFWGYGWPARLAVAKKPGGEVGKEWMPQKEYDEYAAKYRHPLWKSAGEIAKKVGGHGGMDFIMDLRWAYCLQNGLPLDMDVYDLASWSSIVECSRRSDLAGGAPVELPDFTRGAWKTAEPRTIGDVGAEFLKRLT